MGVFSRVAIALVIVILTAFVLAIFVPSIPVWQLFIIQGTGCLTGVLGTWVVGDLCDRS
jgi:hypothetical protein